MYFFLYMKSKPKRHLLLQSQIGYDEIRCNLIRPKSLMPLMKILNENLASSA